MADKKWKSVFSANFSRNIESIRLFLQPKAPSAFDHFLDRLFDPIIPTLCRFPKMGRSFLTRSIQSLEAKELLDHLKTRIKKGDEIREFMMDDYILLYLLQQKTIVFLSIKHHRQLSFDLKRFWK